MKCPILSSRGYIFIHPDDGPVTITPVKELWTCKLDMGHAGSCVPDKQETNADGFTSDGYNLFLD